MAWKNDYQHVTVHNKIASAGWLVPVDLFVAVEYKLKRLRIFGVSLLRNWISDLLEVYFSNFFLTKNLPFGG